MISVNSRRVTARRVGSDVEISILTPGGMVLTTFQIRRYRARIKLRFDLARPLPSSLLPIPEYFECFVKGHDSRIFLRHVEQVGVVRSNGAVTNAVREHERTEAVLHGVHHACAHAAACHGAGNHKSLHAAQRKPRSQRRAEERRRYRLAHYKLALARRELRHDGAVVHMLLEREQRSEE